MKVAIRGCKTQEELIIKAIRNSQIKLVYIIDIDAKRWGEICDGIPIISPMKAYDLFRLHEIDKVIINPLLGIIKVTDIVNEMRNMEFPDNSMVVPNVKELYENCSLSVKSIEKNEYVFENFRSLQYLEYHISDKCNLNCAACSHFSPLVEDEYYPSVIEIQNDLRRIASIVEHIEWIRILGGEPFLNENWLEYLKITRKIFRFSKISIVTNGLLLKSLTYEQIEMIKKLDVWIDISLYRPMWNKIDEVILMLKKKKVNFEMNGSPIFEFTSVFDLDSDDDFVCKRKACNVSCINLYKGKMTPCPIMMYTSFFNLYFNKNLPNETPIDIYSENLDYKKLLKLLKKPKKICQYCNIHQKKKWKNVDKSKCKITDWIVE